MPAPARVLAERCCGPLPRRVWVEQIMGMPVSVHLRGEIADPAVERAVAGVFAHLRAIETELSPWRPDSALNRLRRAELTLKDAGPRLRQVVRMCEVARERTGGWFDAFCAPGQGDPPAPDRLDPTGDRRFDPTGLVKGWAVELAAVRLETLPGVDHCLNAGGDVTVGCSLAGSPDWVIGIEDPADRDRVLLTVPLRHGGIATSGTAVRGAHVLSPDTGLPATQLLSVTVIGPSLTWADVRATAALAEGPGCVARLRTLADHVALVVDSRGELLRVGPDADTPSGS